MARFIEDLAAYIRESGENIYSIAVYHPQRGPERLELQEANACNNIYSVAKAFTVTAVGLLVDRGLLSTEETVPHALGRACPADYDPHWERTSVDMLLRHRIGLPVGALDIDCLDASAFPPDYLASTMAYPWQCEEDTERRYTDAAYYILSRIVAERAGRPLQSFLWEDLFYPLGFREVAWSCCPHGHAMGASGLYIRSDDMVKLGGLYLQKGVWNGQRLLSESWVETVLTRCYEFAPTTPNDPHSPYSKGGMLGQNLMVLPREELAVGWIGHRRQEKADLAQFVVDYFK